MTDNTPATSAIELRHPENGLASPEDLLSNLEVVREARAYGIITTELLPLFRQQLADWISENQTKFVRFEAIEINLIVPAKATSALGEYGWTYLITWLATWGWYTHNHGVANGELHLWVKRFTCPTKAHQRQLLDDLERRSPLR